MIQFFKAEVCHNIGKIVINKKFYILKTFTTFSRKILTEIFLCEKLHNYGGKSLITFIRIATLAKDMIVILSKNYFSNSIKVKKILVITVNEYINIIIIKKKIVEFFVTCC